MEVGWILAAMLLKEVLSNVAEFHTAFRIPNADAPHASLTRYEALLRHRLMAEENDEYLEAANNGDTALMWAAHNGHAKVIEDLLNGMHKSRHI